MDRSQPVQFIERENCTAPIRRNCLWIAVSETRMLRCGRPNEPTLRDFVLHPSTRRRALLAWGAVSLIWGTTYLSNDIGIDSIPPFRYAAMRFLLAGVVLLGATRLRGAWRWDNLPGIMVHPTSLAGMLTLGIGVGLNIWSLQWLPSGLAALLVGVVPLWMVLIERWRFGGRPLVPIIVVGLLLGFGGIGLIAWELGLGANASAPLKAIVGVLGGGLSWAYGSVYTRHRSSPAGLATTAGAQMLWAGALQLTVSLFLGEEVVEVELPSIIALGYTLFIGSCIAYSAYIFALRHLPVAFVSTYVFVNPVVALWLGWLILAEPITPLIIVATVVILAGLALTRLPDWRRHLERAS